MDFQRRDLSLTLSVNFLQQLPVTTCRFVVSDQANDLIKGGFDIILCVPTIDSCNWVRVNSFVPDASVLFDVVGRAGVEYYSHIGADE
jgi:hypothetical protein